MGLGFSLEIVIEADVGFSLEIVIEVVVEDYKVVLGIDNNLEVLRSTDSLVVAFCHALGEPWRIVGE